jgi:hypothetical protein
VAWSILTAGEIEDWAEGVDWYALVYPVILRAAEGLNDHEARLPVPQTGSFSRHTTWTPAGVLDDQLFWDDLVTPATLVNLAGTPAPPAYNDVEMTIDFSATATNTIQLVFQLSHAWATGTTVHFHVHWKPSNTDTGNVLWEHKWRWTSIDAVAGSWTTTTVPEAASGVANKHAIGAIKAISGSGQGISSILQLQLQRLGNDAADTFTGLAQVMSIDVHYQRDAPGTVNEYAKDA